MAKHTGNKALRATTRDVGNYRELMDMRLREIEREQLSYSDIMKVVRSLKAFPGASDFLDSVRARFQVAILSDTFYQFAPPLMSQLGMPFLLCHHLEVEKDRVVGYTLRQEHPKRCAVKAFQSLKYRVIAVGDSLNDCEMLQDADHGVLFRAIESLRLRFPHFDAVEEYDDLHEIFVRYADTHS